jgi:hypothetical protein
MERKVWLEPFDARVVAAGVSLARGDLIGIRNSRGALVFVESGTAWVTQEHDLRDVIVEAGDWLRLDRDGTALVQAHRAAIVTITAPAHGDAPEVFRPGREVRQRRGSWVRRFWAAWLRLHRRHPYARTWDIRQQPAAAPSAAPAYDPIAPHHRRTNDAAAQLLAAISIERGRFV